MSTASAVRETRDLGGAGAWRTLAATGRLQLVWRAVQRLRAADGLSHARSLAFALSVVMVQGLIALVGWAVAFRQFGLTHTILESVRGASPGPSTNVLMWAGAQARHVAHEHQFLPLLVGLGGTLLTATTAAGQVTRGVNRLYGIESDGPFVRKYARAFLLALTTLVSFVVGALVVTMGHRVGARSERDAHLAWVWLRWPVVVGLAWVAFGAILRFAPRRRQPRLPWLVFAGAVGVTGWIAVTVGLALAFRVSTTFGEVYGPLAGIVALQVWAFCVSIATFFGAAVAAELEAARSGAVPREGAA